MIRFLIPTDREPPDPYRQPLPAFRRQAGRRFLPAQAWPLTLRPGDAGWPVSSRPAPLGEISEATADPLTSSRIMPAINNFTGTYLKHLHAANTLTIDRPLRILLLGVPPGRTLGVPGAR